MQTNFKAWMASHPSKTLISRQLLDHFLAKVHLLEFESEHSGQLVISVSRPCLLMYVDIIGNRCQLVYQPRGTLLREISEGANQIMIVTFQTEWLVYRSQSYPEFKPLIEAIQSYSKETKMLPALGTARSLYQAFQRLGECYEVSRERDYYLFFDNLISKYQRKLCARQATKQHHQRKAAAIASFISENFATEMVDNIPKMAERFMVSERHLARIAKSAFGIPLHSQVIKIRMNAGLNQLINSNMPIHEVARLSGYRDPYYFSRAFKKCFQVYPKFINWQENTAMQVC